MLRYRKSKVKRFLTRCRMILVFTAAALSFSVHVDSIVAAVFVFVFLCLHALLRDTEGRFCPLVH